MSNTLFSFLLCVVGIFDAGYITYTRFAGTTAVCLFAHGCETVAQSPYSLMFGIPLSLIGFVLYILSAGLFLGFYKNIYGVYTATMEYVRLFVVTMGFAFSMYFTYLQGFVIHGWCTYCVVSAVLWIALFAITLYVQFGKQNP